MSFRGQSFTWNPTLHFNPFPNKPGFLRICSTGHLKTLREKEKLFKRAISPFPTVFSTHLENFLPFSSNLKLLSANSFSLEEFKICHLGKVMSLPEDYGRFYASPNQKHFSAARLLLGSGQSGHG